MTGSLNENGEAAVIPLTPPTTSTSSPPAPKSSLTAAVNISLTSAASSSPTPTKGQLEISDYDLEDEDAADADDETTVWNDPYDSRPRTSMTPAPATSSSNNSDNIQVLCRFRPESAKELQQGPPSNCIQFDDDDISRVNISVDGKNYGYNYDRVFQPHSTQEDIFDSIGSPTVNSVLEGYNTAILSYGQTGSGKTYTMMGPGFDGNALGADGGAVMGDPGLIPRVMQALFDRVASLEDDHIEFTIRACYIEIYLENVRDLLNPLENAGHRITKDKKSLEIRHDAQRGMMLPKATSVPLQSLQDVFAVLRLGSKNRVVAATKANQFSSRSHAILVITVQKYHVISQSTKVSQMFLVDLAGSEKVEKTEVTGINLTEANLINRGLLSLKQVIQALVQSSQTGKRQHVPYRNSRLTRLLSNCIGGNSRTSLIINASPHEYNLKETFSTLRFGNDMKSIKNHAHVNVELSLTELKALYKESQAENERLKLVIAKLKSEMEVIQEVSRYEQFRKLTSTTSPSASQDDRRPQTTSSIGTSHTRQSSSSATKQLFLTPPAPTSAHSSSSGDDSSAASSPSTSARSIGGGEMEPHSAPGLSSFSSKSTSRSERRVRMFDDGEEEEETKEQSSGHSHHYSLSAEPPAIESSEAAELRQALYEESQSQRNNVILQRLSRPPAARAAAHDLRQLVLHFVCPLSKKIMQDPVICIDGISYERRSITNWFASHSESPVTGQKLSTKILIPNLAMLQQIKKFYPTALRRVGGTGTKGLLSVKDNREGLMHGMDVDYIACLPVALISYLCEWLDYRGLVRVGQCNKELRAISRENRLWKLCTIRKGFPLADAIQMVKEVGGNDFKTYFKIKLQAAGPSAKKLRLNQLVTNNTGVYLIPATSR